MIDRDTTPSRARDLMVAALGFVLILAVELVACTLAPARRLTAPPAKCVLDARAEGLR